MIQLFICKIFKFLSGMSFTTMLILMVLVFTVGENKIKLIFLATGAAVLWGVFAFLAEIFRVPDRLDDLINEVKRIIRE